MFDLIEFFGAFTLGVSIGLAAFFYGRYIERFSWDTLIRKGKLPQPGRTWEYKK